MVHGDIGESWWSESVSAKDVSAQLRALPSSVKALTIRVNSFGGSVADGLAIYNAIREFKGTKKTVIDGVAISAGSLIAMAGDEVTAPATSLVMIHAPWSGVSGNANDMRRSADVLDKWAEAMITAYTRKTGKSTDEIRSLLTDGEDHWYTAEEALAAGFVDRILDDESVSTSAKAALDRAPSAMRFAALAAFRGVPPPLNQPTPPKEVPVAEVQIETPVEAPTASAQSDDVQARVDAAVQAAVAAAVAKVEADAQARVSEAQAAVAEAQARAAVEVEAREVRDAVDAATKAFAHVPGTPDEIGRALRAATKAAPEAAAVLERVLKAADAALKASSITTPVGVAASVEVSVEDRLATLAKAKRDANPALTEEQARSMVYTENADIVAALRGEKD